jgi:hypothetical protein
MVVIYFQSRHMDTLSTRRSRVEDSFRRILFSPRYFSYGPGYAKCVPRIRSTLNHCESIHVLFRLGIYVHGGSGPGTTGRGSSLLGRERESEYALGHAQRKSVESRILKEVLESIQSECLRLRLSQIGDCTSNSDQTFKSERDDVP